MLEISLGFVNTFFSNKEQINILNNRVNIFGKQGLDNRERKMFIPKIDKKLDYT